MASTKSLSQLKKDYEQLKREILPLGLITQGSITSRVIFKTNSADHHKKKKLGPYYQWTWKKQGRTVTVNLSASQVNEFKKAIANNRQLEKIVKQMRLLSMQILDRSTVGVAQRSKRSDIHVLK